MAKSRARRAPSPTASREAVKALRRSFKALAARPLALWRGRQRRRQELEAHDAQVLAALREAGYPLPPPQELTLRSPVPRKGAAAHEWRCFSYQTAGARDGVVLYSNPDGESGAFCTSEHFANDEEAMPAHLRFDRRVLTLLHEVGHQLTARDVEPLQPTTPHPCVPLLNAWVFGPFWDGWWRLFLDECLADTYAAAVYLHATRGSTQARMAVDYMREERRIDRTYNEAEAHDGPLDEEHSYYNTDGALARLLQEESGWMNGPASELWSVARRCASDHTLEWLGLLTRPGVPRSRVLLCRYRKLLLEGMTQLHRRDLGFFWWCPLPLHQRLKARRALFLAHYPDHPIQACHRTLWGWSWTQVDRLRAARLKAHHQLLKEPSWALPVLTHPEVTTTVTRDEPILWLSGASTLP